MSNTPNLDKLSPLQRRAAVLSAQGLSDVEIKDTLALSVTSWEQWRGDAIFNAALGELKGQGAPEKVPAEREGDALDAAVDALSR